jgi:hypothetical protein
MGEMFSMVFGDVSLYSQMLDAENMSEQELFALAHQVSAKLGSNNIRPERLLSALRNIA